VVKGKSKKELDSKSGLDLAGLKITEGDDDTKNTKQKSLHEAVNYHTIFSLNQARNQLLIARKIWHICLI